MFLVLPTENPAFPWAFYLNLTKIKYMQQFSTNSLMKVVLISSKEPECFTFSNEPRYFASSLDIVRFTTDQEAKKFIVENIDAIDAIVTQDECEWNVYEYLSSLPLWIRRKWFHFKDYENHGQEVYDEIYRKQLCGTDTPMFSFFTPLYKTNLKYFKEAYESLKKQTYNNWEWVLVDDSPKPCIDVVGYIEKLKDPRIRYFRIAPTNGNIGLSKWRACCMTRGTWLIEFDHDDFIIHPMCLDTMKKAIQEFAHKDVGFVYTDDAAVDENSNWMGKIYGDSYAFDFAHPYEIDGIPADESPNINSCTIRHIVGVPNHIRCWRRDIYFKIGGHNQTQRIADDYELCVRTFLETRFLKIPYPMYAQRFYNGNSQDSDVNRSDIQRRVSKIANLYNELIHERMLQLVGEDLGYKKGCTAEQVSSYVYNLEDKSQVPFVNYIYHI